MAIRLDNVSKSFDGAPVIAGCSIEFPERGVVAVRGLSGAGKTTLLRIIAGLELPDSGSVAGVPDRVSMQFEDDRLFPWMDVLANIMLVGCDEAIARGLLSELGLEGREHACLSELSGGQKRRVALARALAYPAPLCLLDEPTARLDELSASIALDAIARHRADGLTVIATHDPQAVERCDSIVDVTRWG